VVGACNEDPRSSNSQEKVLKNLNKAMQKLLKNFSPKQK